MTSSPPAPAADSAADIARDRWVLLAAAAALALGCWRLDAAALWHDEMFSARWVRLPWLEMLRDLTADNHLPLYPLLLKLWVSAAAAIGGGPADSAWLLRLPNVLLATVNVPLIAALAATLTEPGRNRPTAHSVGRWAAWFTALSPFLLHHAQEARMYPLLCLLACWQLLLLARYLRGHGNPPRLGLGFVVSALLLLLTHYYSLFFLAGTLLALVLCRHRPWRHWLPAAALCSVLMLALTVFALLVPSLNSGERYDIGWLALPGVGWAMLTGYVLMPSAEQLHAGGAGAVGAYLPYALLALAPTLALAVGGLLAATHTARLLLGAVLACVLFGPFAAHLLLPSLSVNPRYFIAAAPALFVWLAFGAATPTTAGGRLTRPAGLIVAGLFTLAITLHLAAPGQKRADIHAAGRWLDANLARSELLLVSSSEMADLSQFHWPERNIVLYPKRDLVVTAANVDALIDQLPGAAELAAGGRVHYLFGRIWVSDPEGLLRQGLAERHPSCGRAEFRGIVLTCLGK